MEKSDDEKRAIAIRLGEIAFETISQAHLLMEDLDEEDNLVSPLCMAIIIKLGSFIVQGIVKEDVARLTEDCIDLFRMSIANDLKLQDKGDLN